MNFGSGKNFSNNPSDKINLAPKVNFGQLKGQPSTSSILFPLQSEKKRLFDAAGTEQFDIAIKRYSFV